MKSLVYSSNFCFANIKIDFSIHAFCGNILQKITNAEGKMSKVHYDNAVAMLLRRIKGNVKM